MKLDLLWMYDSWHSKYDPAWAHEDVNYAKKSCMYDQMPNYPVYECDLQNGVWVPGTSFEKHADIINGLQRWMGAPEGVAYLWTVNDDFGTAPASYDGTDGASHVLSDLRIGNVVSSTGGELADANGKVNNSGTSGIVSPNAGGTDAGDDAFVSVPAIPTSGDYSVSVPVTGVTQNAKLCGWIDVDASGSFDTVERQCVNVAPNSTSAVLVWPESLVGSISGNTYMRLRLSYDLVGVESPNGRVASGEVEDWRVGRVSTPPPGSPRPPAPPLTNELPKTGGSAGMTPAGFIGIVGGAIILTIRRRQLR
jgi:LPXTG-motif cell wall-anchored protein